MLQWLQDSSLVVGIVGIVLAVAGFSLGVILKVKFGSLSLFLTLLLLVSAFMVVRSVGLI